MVIFEPYGNVGVCNSLSEGYTPRNQERYKAGISFRILIKGNQNLLLIYIPIVLTEFHAINFIKVFLYILIMDAVN